MSWALVRKELREHAWIALLALVLNGASLFALALGSERDGGRFIAFTRLLGALGVINAIVAANRLFVREYGGRTQLFLEVLPITRTRVFTTKWLLGALWLGLLTSSAWLYVLLRQRAVEVIALSDALHVLNAGAAFMLAVWAFAVMAGMLGRHRYTAWLALLLVTVVAVDTAGLSLEELPTVRLVDSRTAMAHSAVPWSALYKAWAVAACCSTVAACLALVGSGAIASALAKRMTTRERVFILASVICAAFLYGTLHDERVKPPFLLSDAHHEAGEHAMVAVLRTRDLDETNAGALAWQLSRDVDGMIAALQLDVADTITHVFVLPQQGFDRFVIERASLRDSRGIVLRTAADVPRDLLRAEALHWVIDEHTRHRATKEDRHALLDGFAVWWAVQGDEPARQRWWLRAASSSMPISARMLERWNETSDALGEHIASSVAFAVVDVLAQRLGREHMLDLLGRLWQQPRDDVRVLLEPSPRERLASAGLTLDALAAHTERERTQRSVVQLAKRPALRAAIRVVNDAQRGTTVETELNGLSEPAYSVLYGTRGPWQRFREPIARLDVRARKATLPISPRGGTFLQVAIEVEDPVLDCNVRVASRRIELP